uniref:Uncharacterized protein n=1 Tax=Heterorhabditis bacteriophora TaxID=37862 RepID=A0A1I7XLS1_HETBA
MLCDLEEEEKEKKRRKGRKGRREEEVQRHPCETHSRCVKRLSQSTTNPTGPLIEMRGWKIFSNGYPSHSPIYNF